MSRDGVLVKSGDVTRRLVGFAGTLAQQSGYNGVIDVKDARLVRNLYRPNDKVWGKDPGYSTGTTRIKLRP